MSAGARLALAGLIRSPARTVVRIVVLALAVALLGSMLLFIGHSLRTMAGSAIRGVPLDWQGPVSSYTQARSVAAGVAAQRGVIEALPAASAPFAGAVHTGMNGSTSAGSGAILAVPADYQSHIDTFRFLRGTVLPGEVALDQQLAATLKVQIGESVSLSPRPGAAATRMRVSGVVLVTAADVLFQPLNPLLGPAPAQPPANIAVMGIDTFAKTFASTLPVIAAAAPGASAVPGAQSGVQWQVQAQVDPSSLGKTPATALRSAGQLVNRVQRSLPGRVQFVDNLSEALNSATGDALYAQTLYIMLAVPGALIALALGYLAALGSIERDRRDLALLRARGASRQQLLWLAGTESVAIGVLAGLLAAGTAFAAVSLIIDGELGVTPTRATLTTVVCVALAIAGAAAARIGATASAWRTSVIEARRSVRREGRPLWQKLYLDVAAIAVSGLIYWLTASTGFSAIVNPDSNPTLSLSVYMFFAPALLWLGATLLLIRLRGRVLAWTAARAGGVRARSLRGFLLASASRRGAAINRGLLVIGLLLAFGVSLGIFTATYDQQAGIDAQLTLGADITVSAPPGAIAAHDLAAKVRAIPGVSATTTVDHSYAYVGPDLQDTYGIDPATIGGATTLRDSYFLGGTVSEIIGRLRSTPDGILVSKETIGDYSLRIGDLLKLRVLDHADGRFHVVPFHVVGVVQEFPSAPRDSFMVANLGYLQAADHAGGANVIFAKSSDPRATSIRVAAATSAYGTTVKDIGQQTQQTVSSITTVDLRGISDIEEAFTIALAAAAMGLFVALAVIERRPEFATMAALGGTLRSIEAFVWSEVAIVLAAATVLATVLGWLLSLMLIAMLEHVFDPPPDHLAVPWGYLASLLSATLVAAVLATAIAAGGLRRLPLGAILREQ